MSYVDELATEIERHVPADLLPEGDTRQLFRIYALLALTKGRAVSSEDVHDAWAVWMLGQDPSHDAIRPFDTLDAETQASDMPYLKAIRAAVGKQHERAPA